MIESVRRYVGEQDGSPNAEELCSALVTTLTRMRKSLGPVFRLGMLAYVTSSIVNAIWM